MRALRGLPVALAIAAVIPSAASAASASVKDGAVQYIGASGEANDLTVSLTDAGFKITDLGATITPGQGCATETASKVICSADDRAVVARLGDRNDVVRPGTGIFHVRYEGGSGNDRITAGEGHDTLNGDAGDDDLTCGAGFRCEMRGGTGADWMIGATSPATVGGVGAVTYDDHPDGVRVTVDGIADDGNASDGPVGERDKVMAVSTVRGGPGDDYLRDGAQPVPHPNYSGVHVLWGGGGDDELLGLDGEDSLAGGAGTDVLDGGAHDDDIWPDYDGGEVDASAGPSDVVTGGTGVDAVRFWREASVHVSLDGVANDGVPGEADNVLETENVFSLDVGSLGAGADVITGDGGPNHLGGGGGHDSINGGGGPDILYGSYGTDELNGGPGNDALWGGDTSDSYFNVRDPDYLIGGSGNDSLNGHGGDDRLDGGTGADVIAGGPEIDTVEYPRTTALVVSMAGGADDGADPDGDGVANEGDDVGVSVENFSGGSGADRVTGNSAANHIAGGGGGDRLAGLAGNDLLEGGTGADTLDGGTNNDRLLQAKEPDEPDVMIGGTGIDNADYTPRPLGVAVTLDGSANDGDRARTEGDNVGTDVETVTGGAGPDTLTGSSADNRLLGGAGDDVLNGGLGADDFTGGFGNDAVTYFTRGSAVTADLDGLADDGGTADQNTAGLRDRIRTDVEHLRGGAGADTLTGNSAANTLLGYGGADRLTGGGAADLLTGGDGDDLLFSRGDGAADTDDCGVGAADEVTADAADATSGCEIAH